MDYTQPDEGMPGKMGLVKGASTCCIRVTSRRKRLKGNDFRTVRSIWVIADDGKTCIQQKCPSIPSSHKSITALPKDAPPC